jgi:ABC-2 type transport system permease protein
MKGLGAIWRRELVALFFAPLAWVLFSLTALFQAYFFLFALDSSGAEVNRSLVYLLGGGPFWFLAVIVPPLLTMRMISEESRSGLLEYLLTAPVSDVAVVTGKALAAATFFAALLADVFVFGGVVAALGAAPDWGVLFTAWLGAALVGGLFCTLGLVASALSGTPVLAAFLAILGNVALLSLQILRGMLGGKLAALLGRLDVNSHLAGSFLRGALDTGHVGYFLAWSLAALFLAVRLVESRRWLG